MMAQPRAPCFLTSGAGRSRALALVGIGTPVAPLGTLERAAAPAVASLMSSFMFILQCR